MVQIEEEKLNRLQKRLKIIAFLSLAAVFVLFIFGAWKSFQISKDITERKTELENIKKNIGDGQKEIEDQQKQIQENNKLIESQNKMLKIYFDTASEKTTSEVLEKTPKDIANEVLTNTPNTLKSIPPRIYLQIGKESQRPATRKLQTVLQNKGFIVPGIENVGGKATANTELRYCKDKLQSDVDNIKNFLSEEKIPFKEVFIQGCGSRGYEIWFGDDFIGPIKEDKQPVNPKEVLNPKIETKKPVIKPNG
jgi:hypothetical protein